MTDGKKEAWRIMEALSGADPELLERCNAKRKPVWQYGRAWAACIALLVVGAVSWGAFRFIATPHGSVFDENKSGGAIGDQAMGVVTEGEEMGQTSGQGQQAGKGELQEENGAGGDRGQDDAGVPGDSPEDTDGACGIPESPYQEIAYEHALGVETLGGYIPSQLPRGYSLESVMAQVSQTDGSTDSLFLTWTRGMDYITLCIDKAGTSQPATVDIDRPETYDMRLYQVPYGESVPEEYQESVMHPVFAWEDMSLEVVESRMVVPEGDAGDTGTPRGDFTVLYPDGVLMRFTGRGTPEEIWALFCE